PYYSIDGSIFLDDEYLVNVFVKFDTNNWYLSEDGGVTIKESDYIYKVLIDRFGYSWLAWAVGRDNTNQGLVHVLPGNAYRTDAMSTEEQVNLERDTLIFDNELFSLIYGQYYSESMTSEVKTSFNLYADWKANEYSILYDYSDAGTAIQYPASKYVRNLGETRNSIGTTFASASDLLENFSNARTVMFDTPLYSLAFTNYVQVSRTGYIFNGWRFHKTNDAILQTNYDSNGNMIYQLTLDLSYIQNNSAATVATSGYTSDCFLYYFYESNSYTHEALGDQEIKNQQEACVVLYADWTARKYEVQFDFNNNYTKNFDQENLADTVYNSTSATELKYRNPLTGVTTRTVYVEFDTNDWYSMDGVTKIEKSLLGVYVSRTGYTFLGWYTTRTMNMYNNTAVSSLVYDDETKALYNLNNTTYNKIAGSSSETNGYLTETQKAGVTGWIKLYAGWQQNTYTAVFELHDSLTTNSKWLNGTTEGFFSIPTTGYTYNTNYEDFTTKYQIRVLFDTTEYVLYTRYQNTDQYIETNYNLYNVLVDRYGYTWTGWYIDAGWINGVRQDQNNILVDWHTADALISSPDVAKQYPMTKFDINMYNAVVPHNEIDIEADRQYYLYAGWKANTYSIVYDLNDANGINNKIYGQSGAGTSIAEFTPTVTTLTFDADINTSLYKFTASRTGYIFAGWSLSYKYILDG
ncbi:MAG: hypothetical protein IJA23_04190, partial [Clostridia bacterium]|nr:hypothetical protein [Clostridia bacterium]